MPHYDYYCKSCNKEFEIFQKMSEEPIKICPECGGELIRRIGAGAGPIFKGSGFYQTDYKNSNKKSSDKKEESKSSPEKSTKSETSKKE